MILYRHQVNFNAENLYQQRRVFLTSDSVLFVGSGIADPL